MRATSQDGVRRCGKSAKKEGSLVSFALMIHSRPLSRTPWEHHHQTVLYLGFDSQLQLSQTRCAIRTGKKSIVSRPDDLLAGHLPGSSPPSHLFVNDGFRFSTNAAIPAHVQPERSAPVRPKYEDEGIRRTLLLILRREQRLEQPPLVRQSRSEAHFLRCKDEQGNNQYGSCNKPTG